MAEKTNQLGNVAFGGNWSEELIVLERLNAMLEVIEGAARACHDRDVRGPELDDALGCVRDKIEKGPMLAARFEEALGRPDPRRRQSEARRLARQIRIWAGVRMQTK